MTTVKAKGSPFSIGNPLQDAVARLTREFSHVYTMGQVGVTTLLQGYGFSHP